MFPGFLKRFLGFFFCQLLLSILKICQVFIAVFCLRYPVGQVFLLFFIVLPPGRYLILFILISIDPALKHNVGIIGPAFADRLPVCLPVFFCFKNQVFDMAVPLPFQLIPRVFGILGPCLQFLLNIRVENGPEHLLKQIPSFIAGGIEDLQKIILGDHHGLGELIPGQAHQFLHLIQGLVHSCDGDTDARPCQRNFRRVFGSTASPFFRPVVFGTSAYGVFSVQMAEGQLHIGFSRGIRIVGPEGLIAAPLAAAGSLSVQGKADGIENSRFAGPGITRYQKQPRAPVGHSFKIDTGFTLVGAEGAHSQPDRFHASDPLSF